MIPCLLAYSSYSTFTTCNINIYIYIYMDDDVETEQGMKELYQNPWTD